MTPPSEKGIGCRPHVRPVAEPVDLTALARVVAAKNAPAILGGNSAVRGQSIFAAEPLDVFEFCLHESSPFEKLNAFLSRYRLADPLLPADGFCGGWIGCFSYELGRFIETLPQQAVNDIPLPVIRLAFYDKAILYDHPTNRLSMVAVETDNRSDVETKYAALAEWLSQAAEQAAPATQSTAIDAVDPTAARSAITRDEYIAAIDTIHRHIRDGDVYQINYSRRVSAPYTAHPIDLFNWQNRCNPSPYAAYLSWNNTAVVSASPELFLDVRGDRIVTHPIKGTRPRNPDLPDDHPANRAQVDALVESKKDQAELAMIVDLERNDLARVCIPGTRHVPCTRRIETFPTVYHAVATVAGTLAVPPSPRRIEALLRAAFPGGSITGAPKIRAMQIIDALEPTARGIYTGSIGWIGLNFDLCLNIAIRTAVIHDRHVFIQTGGGIVADSDARDEWEETVSKARALLAGVAATRRPNT